MEAKLTAALGGTPTGTVTFYDGSTILGTVNLSGGSASLSTSSLPVGSDAISAVYSGSSSFAASSAALTQTVNILTDTTFAATSPSVYGQAVTFTVTVSPVSPGYGIPTGTVTFSIDGGSGTTVNLSGGTASFTPSSILDAGSHTITASYSGSAPYLSSNGSATQVVNKAVLTVTADNQTMVYGASLPTLTGSLTGVVNGDNITATFTTTATSTSDVIVGGYPITPVLYDPDNRLSNYNVISNDGTLTITPANQVITWNTPAAITYGTSLDGTQLNASVTVVGPAVG